MQIENLIFISHYKFAEIKNKEKNQNIAITILLIRKKKTFKPSTTREKVGYLNGMGLEQVEIE